MDARPCTISISLLPNGELDLSTSMKFGIDVG